MRTIADKIFTEMSLPSKKAFYRNLAIESITDADYKHAKRRVWIDFRLQSLGQYHDLYVQSDTLLRIHYCVFKSFKNKHVEIYELKPGLFLSAPRLACWACLKKTGAKLQLLTDADMLVMIKKASEMEYVIP